MEEPLNPKNPESEESKKAVKEDALNLWQSIKSFMSELLDIREDTDRDSTIEAVKKDISFKGHNAWILIFAIFVASIGLNVGSTAVIIGAMLISPLMGPIVGAGLSLAINDVEMLRRSMINLAVMVSLSVLTAFIYFLLIPLKADNSELLGRTYPTILDVLVAIFGGLALILFHNGMDVLNTEKEAAFIKDNYEKSEDISIDYGILEKGKNVGVIPATFDWSDLGAWGALYDKLDKDDNQNVIVNAGTIIQDGTGNLIRSEKGKVVVVEGLSNYIVVDRDDVLLILPRDREQQVKPLRGEVKTKFGEKMV